MVGRVLRTHPGKEDALVLDLVGASTSNKLRTLIDLEPGAVQSMRPGETLEEAVEREENEQPTPSPGQAPKFALKVRHVSMFDTSSKAWLQTRAGVRFISCGDVTVFLWPAGENWDVCMAPRRADRAMKWERTEHRGLDLARAMLMGELVAEDHQAFSLEKRASWRRSKASDAQIRTAENMGITGTEKMNKGEVSAAIDIVMKSRLFDRYALNIS
jgi:hypothetical protein